MMTKAAKAALHDGIDEAEDAILRMSAGLIRMERKGIAGAGKLRELLGKFKGFVDLAGDLAIADTIRKNTVFAGVERAREVAEIR